MSSFRSSASSLGASGSAAAGPPRLTAGTVRWHCDLASDHWPLTAALVPGSHWPGTVGPTPWPTVPELRNCGPRPAAGPAGGPRGSAQTSPQFCPRWNYLPSGPDFSARPGPLPRPGTSELSGSG
eukprot:183153-Hanusia_phi.AAC.1